MELRELLLVLIFDVVGLALVPTIASSTNSSVNALTGNYTAASALAILVPLAFVVLIVYANFHYITRSG